MVSGASVIVSSGRVFVSGCITNFAERKTEEGKTKESYIVSASGRISISSGGGTGLG